MFKGTQKVIHYTRPCMIFSSEFHMIIFKDDTIKHAKVEIENAARPQSYIQSRTDNKEWLGK